MPTMTFASLSADLGTYCDRANDPDFQAAVPGFISDAEAEMARRITTIVVQRSIQGSLTQGSPYLIKPATWHHTMSMSVAPSLTATTVRPLKLRTLEFVRQYWPDPYSTDADQPPEYYSDLDSSVWYISPTPAANLPFETVVAERPPGLSVLQQTNEWTARAPDVLRAGAMANANRWAKNFDSAGAWEARFEKGLAAMEQDDTRRIVDREQEITGTQ